MLVTEVEKRVILGKALSYVGIIFTGRCWRRVLLVTEVKKGVIRLGEASIVTVLSTGLALTIALRFGV